MATTNESADNRKFMLLLIAGFFIIFLGIIILLVATFLHSAGAANFGTIIFIGPFPIVIGAGPEAIWMIFVAIVIAALSIIMFWIMCREMKKTGA
ncbi:MAG: DUF131 domain-containing protein [Candidatus Bathyarchaeota archaeon]|jgi:uncharacterized membrane protein|nr:DUF131 domain-containing protein [Candidatus Bathyarchaeota archaeon A05DMB-5]MDH7556978.1 DUF131 domain-containing protein [Candidatus Bathyarchaeota archaeon]